MKLSPIILALALSLSNSLSAAPKDQIVGPYVGTITPSEAFLIYRPGTTKQKIRLTAFDNTGKKVAETEASALPENDFAAKFHLKGLSPNTQYSYTIDNVDDSKPSPLVPKNKDNYFKTPPLTRTGQILNTAFISCVNDTTDGIWKQMLSQPLDLLALCGDTPYVDTGDMIKIRSKHRHLLQRPDLAKIIKNTSILGTWDDHDFGKNNGNGATTSAKTNTKKGFIEYRAHNQYGTGPEGIYHKADMGAAEIFMLDPRWFSMTGPSPINSTQPTSFGSEQWEWLLKSLKESEAPFKILVQGQIWQDKKNSETDDMFTYWAERDALLDFIKKEKISGVIVLGGDIHVSRYLLHPQRIGYDLHDFVISPGHTSVIKSLNVYHPSLNWSRAEANQYLTIKADTTKADPELTVTFTDKDGKNNHQTKITLSELTPKANKKITRDLRAYWPLDKDLTNQSILGKRIDATAQNGARLTPNGAQGGSIKLDGSKEHYLKVPRSFLDDNASSYTYSAWIKPSELPEHGSTDRHFILESNINNHCNLPQASSTGYAISAGFKATSDPKKINLELYTETLKPATIASKKPPTAIGQGGFEFKIDRASLETWTHVAVTFDSKSLNLYINGKLAKSHELQNPGPIAETGGLIIGGHRAGTGSNYTGLIDEIAIWNRTLTTAEISNLYNGGKPKSLTLK